MLTAYCEICLQLRREIVALEALELERRRCLELERRLQDASKDTVLIGNGQFRTAGSNNSKH